MTDNPKPPATPGMEEVSAKFVDEAEAAVEAAAIQKAHDAIVAVLAKVPPRDEDETQIEGVYRKLLALREYGPPRGRTDEEMAAWIDSHDGLEEEIGTLRAENFHDVETKLAVICDRIKLNLGPDEQPVDGDLLIAQSARDDLRRIAGESGVARVAQPDTALSTLWQEWQRLWEANKQAVEEAQNDELASEIFATLAAVERRMEDMLACTVTGVLNKLRVAAVWIDTNHSHPEDKMGVTERLVLSARADLERLAGVAVPIGAVSVIEDPVLALKREWTTRWERYASEPDQSDKVTDQLNDRVNEVAYEIFQTPATTPAGIAFKLILWARQHITRGTQENPDWSRPPVSAYSSYDLDHLPVVSALHDLERMAQGIAPSTIKDPVIDEPLLALEQRWQEAVKAHEEAGIDTEEERLTESLEAQKQILTTPARSVAGVLVKLHVYAGWDAKTDGPPIDEQSIDNYDFDTAAVWGAMFDLERLAHPTTVAETPPAEDAALFDALAEFDRLTAIEQGLERRKDVFRPDTPEAKEANEAYQAACDKAMEAWEKVRAAPATTQAGLLARLQATDRYMTDFGEDSIYAEDWCVIKADVQRIAG